VHLVVAFVREVREAMVLELEPAGSTGVLPVYSVDGTGDTAFGTRDRDRIAEWISPEVREQKDATGGGGRLHKNHAVVLDVLGVGVKVEPS